MATVVAVFCALVALLLLALGVTCHSRWKSAEQTRVLAEWTTARRETLAQTGGDASKGGGGRSGATAVNPAFAAQALDDGEYEEMQQRAAGAAVYADARGGTAPGSAGVADYLVPGSPAFASPPGPLPVYDVLENPAAGANPYLVLEGGKKMYEGHGGGDTAA